MTRVRVRSSVTPSLYRQRMSCAICTSTIGPFTKQRLGPDEPEVSVCANCDEPPVSRDRERTYEPSSSLPSAREGIRGRALVLGDRPPRRHVQIEQRRTMRQMIKATGVHPPRRVGSPGPSPLDRRPGCILVRMSDRTVRTREAAMKAAEPGWRYLGRSKGFWLFEKPDPEAGAALRAQQHPPKDPLAPIAKHRTK